MGGQDVSYESQEKPLQYKSYFPYLSLARSRPMSELCHSISLMSILLLNFKSYWWLPGRFYFMDLLYICKIKMFLL